jgi:2-oxo-4-hydroxy-4-carboxy-5-ureidoimidazoline decarboxylase
MILAPGKGDATTRPPAGGMVSRSVMAEPKWTIVQVNEFAQDEFVDRLGFLFEGSPWIMAEAWHARPFTNRADLHRELCAVVQRAPDELQIALISSHPDLVGRAALEGTLTRESSAEQAAAGLDLDRLSPEEIAAFTTLNAVYRDKFGFPFVICARENMKASILAGMQTRLSHDREDEIETALREIEKICHYRLIDVVEG